MEGYQGYEEVPVEYSQEEEYEDALEEDAEDGHPMDYPTPKSSESIYALFQKVLKQKDNSKVANLDKAELGSLNMSVRDCQKIALLADTLHHPSFADFFRQKGEIILTTSASKKGWFTELFVSQKKLTTKTTSSSVLTPKVEKKKWFGKKDTPQQAEY